MRASPLVFAIVLLGPGADRLRGYVHDLASELDRESGEFVHWLILGDPRRTRAEGRRFLEAEGADLGELRDRWHELLADCADEDDLVARETDLLVREYRLSIEDLPAVLFLVPGSVGSGIPLRLPVSVLDSIERARTIFSVLREHLARFAGRPAMGNAVARLVAELQLAVNELIQGPLGEEFRSLPNDLKKHAFVNMVRNGMTAKATAKVVGISRQAVYEDPRFKEQLKAAAGARRRVSRGKAREEELRRNTSTEASLGDE